MLYHEYDCFKQNSLVSFGTLQRDYIGYNSNTSWDIYLV